MRSPGSSRGSSGRENRILGQLTRPLVAGEKIFEQLARIVVPVERIFGPIERIIGANENRIGQLASSFAPE
jgi:hypothetical protein